jgi:hypothetical protein
MATITVTGGTATTIHTIGTAVTTTIAIIGMVAITIAEVEGSQGKTFGLVSVCGSDLVSVPIRHK